MVSDGLCTFVELTCLRLRYAGGRWRAGCGGAAATACCPTCTSLDLGIRGYCPRCFGNSLGSLCLKKNKKINKSNIIA